MKNISGKLSVVTGAASGIGRALAIKLAARGSDLALADIDKSGLEVTRDTLAGTGVRCTTHVVDVADRKAVDGFARDVAREHGRVNLLINNAGVTLISTAEGVEYGDFEWIMNINFWGVVYGTKSFLPYLREADEAHIVNVSSLFGLMSVPLQSAYNASKFAVRGFTESLKMEMAGTHIGVSSVHPGGVRTAIARSARIGNDVPFVTREKLTTNFDKAARTTSEQAAVIIIHGIEKNRRRILVGRDSRILDKIVRLLPGSYEKILRLETDVRRHARRSRQD